MTKTLLDILREENQSRKIRQKKSLLAFLQDLNEEHRREKQRDRFLDIFRQPPEKIKKRTGTLLIGVKCRDGLIIASDRKIARGGEIEYSNKVFEFNLGGPIIFAAEGLTGIRDDFFLLLQTEIQRRKGVDSLYEVKIIVEDIIANLTERYAERVRESSPIGVLMGGLRELTKGPAVLYYIHSAGYGELVSFMCTGHGGPYAYPLAKFLFDPGIQPDICIEESVKRAAFVTAWVAEDVWGRMSIMDTKPFMRPVARHNISSGRPPAPNIPA